MKLLGAHQNIVSLVGCCTLQGHKFLVIEYVPFGDLLQWLRRRRRSVRRFAKEHLNNLMLPQLFGSNGFYGNSVLKDSGVVFHEIVLANYMWLLSIYQSSRLTCSYIGFSMVRCLPSRLCYLCSKHNKISSLHLET